MACCKISNAEAKAAAALLTLTLGLVVVSIAYTASASPGPQSPEAGSAECYQRLNAGSWESPPERRPRQPAAKPAAKPASPQAAAACARPGLEARELKSEVCWAWSRVLTGGRRQQPHPGCSPRHLDPGALAGVFAGARLTLVGDSHVRYLYSRLSLRLGGNYSVEKFTEDRFTHLSGPGIELAMHWKVLSRNQTALLREWAKRGAPPPPDLLVMGGGSWDIYKVSKNVTLWEQSMDRLVDAVRRYLGALRARGARPPVLVWATTPFRVKGRANLREEVPAELIPVFNAAAVSRLVQPAGPFGLLDLYGLTKECWEWCVPDGTHGAVAVNDVAVQVLANLYSHSRHRQDQLLLKERGQRQGMHGAVDLLRNFLRVHVIPS